MSCRSAMRRNRGRPGRGQMPCIGWLILAVLGPARRGAPIKQYRIDREHDKGLSRQSRGLGKAVAVLAGRSTGPDQACAVRPNAAAFPFPDQGRDAAAFLTLLFQLLLVAGQGRLKRARVSSASRA